MKRVFALFMTLCLLTCSVILAEDVTAPFVGTWIETEGYGTLTIRLDGSATMIYYDGTVMDTTWGLTDDGYRFGDGMWYNSPMVLLDDNTLSVSGGWMIFAREGFLPTTDEALLLDAEPVGEEGEPYLGQWELVSLIIEDEEVDPALFGLTMTLTFNEDGTVISDDGWEPYTTTWYVDNGFAIIEFDILYIDDENDLLIFDQEGDSMIFARVLTAETDPASLADPVPVGEEGEPYLGLWTLTSIEMDGTAIDPALFGMTLTLDFYADGTVSIDVGLVAELYTWAVTDNGVYVDGMPLTLDENGCLTLIDEDGSKMIFTSGEVASNSELSDEEQMLALLQLISLMSGVEAEPATGAIYMDVKYVCTSYTTAGFTLDASTLGAEYAVTFHDDGTADFILSGISLPGQPYAVNDDGSCVIDYYGMPFTCTPTDTGFDMDYYGAMMMHFIPAE